MSFESMIHKLNETHNQVEKYTQQSSTNYSQALTEFIKKEIMQIKKDHKLKKVIVLFGNGTFYLNFFVNNTKDCLDVYCDPTDITNSQGELSLAKANDLIERMKTLNTRIDYLMDDFLSSKMNDIVIK